MQISSLLPLLAYAALHPVPIRGAGALCRDDPKYQYEGRKGTCAKFVAQDPAVRCGLRDGTLSLSVRCPLSCGACADCRDVRGKIPGVDKSCGWAAKQPARRCRRKVGAGKERVANYCVRSCGACPERRCAQQKVTAQQLAPSGTIEDHRQPNHFFGYATAVSGDTLVVGAQHTHGLYGTVYVYQNDHAQGAWVLEATLSPAVAIRGNKFGFSVALEDDLLVVGAAFEESNSGAAYVFRRVDWGEWEEVQRLVPYDRKNTYHYFAGAVGITAGKRIVVGSWSAADQRNQLYFYEPDEQGWKSGTWSDGPAVVFEEDGADFNVHRISPRAGGRVAVSGMRDGQGAVYVFNGSDLEQTVVFPHEDPTGFGRGPAVGLSADALAIGAFVRTAGVERSGCVLLYARKKKGFSKRQDLCFNGGGSGTHFGSAVAVAGDVLAVGAQYHEDGGGMTGAAYLYAREGRKGEWTLDRRVEAEDGAAADRLGFALSMIGSVVAIGAYQDDTGRGAVYMEEAGCS